MAVWIEPFLIGPTRSQHLTPELRRDIAEGQLAPLTPDETIDETRDNAERRASTVCAGQRVARGGVEPPTFRFKIDVVGSCRRLLNTAR